MKIKLRSSMGFFLEMACVALGLHQSSMGSMFLIMPQKLYPLWYTPLLPVFFLISSVAAGLCMPIIESFFALRLSGETLDKSLLSGLGQAASAVLILYFGLRVADLTARHAWGSVVHVPLLGFVFLLELIGGVLIPAVLFLRPRFRSRIRGLLGPSLLVAGGVVLDRLCVSWFSLLPESQGHYFPTWMELAVSLSLFLAVAALFGLAVRHLPVFPVKQES